MLLRLTKRFTFEMAHALPSYSGKCHNIHGHSYKLFVTVEGEPSLAEGSPTGMVIDFGDLKKEVRAALDQTSPRQRACIRALYYDGKKMRQYARETGCSHQFISKTTKNTLRRMRGLLKKRNVV